MSTKFRFIIVLSALLLFGFGQAAYAQCPVDDGATPITIGSENPNNGFPQFVVDSNGLSLELCLDSDPPGSGLPPNCFYDRPDPDPASFSAEIGFGAEAFWWAADATIDAATPVGPISAILVQAVEAAFLTETPANGDQFPFTRLRIRIDVPVAGTYLVTHPYGQITYFVAEDDLGPGNEILDSFDIEFAANTMHQGRVGPFLTWDPIADAPAGFVGDGATPHLVTGSPCLTNFFQIEGPGGINVSTNDFVVQGKLSTNFGLAVDRATYNSLGFIDVFASSVSVPQQTLVVDDGTVLTAMTGDGTGKYFASIPFTTIPSDITVTNLTDDPDTVLMPDVTDLVTISSAEYDAGTLTVAASSSVSTAILTGIGTFTDVITPPATVTVTSDAGGSDTEPVVVAVAPAAAGVCAIVVSPLSLPFGSVNVGTTVTLTVNISNAAGTADCVVDLTVTSTTGIGQFALNPGSPTPIFTVEAGGPTVVVSVDYTPADILGDTGTLDIVSNDPAGMVSVALTGTGAAACTITATPPAPDFGLVEIGTTATLPVTIENTGTIDCTASGITVDSATGEFALNPVPALPFLVEPGVLVDVSVEYSPLDAGLDTGTLDITSDDGGLVSVPLSGTGSVAEIITVQRAQFRANNAEWRIDGTTTIPGPGNFIHIHLGDAVGTEIGETEVDNLGGWSFKERNSPTLPNGATTVTVHSTGGAIVTAVPLQIR